MKKKAHSLLALLLSLSLTLSLCAPAAGAAELSDLAGEGDCSAVTVSDTEGEENAPEESTSTEPEDASPEESAQGDASADGESSGPDMESQEENAPQDSAPEQPSEEEQEEQEQTSEPQEAEHRTVRSAEQLSDFLAQEFTGDYFVEAVVDTKRDRVSVDGEQVSLTDAFGAEADREAIFDSPEAAKAYFEDTPYEAESVGGGKVVVTSPWQTCRIVVSAKALDGDYGAETVVEYPKYHQFVLQFADEETTQAAYESLSARYTCYVDQILSADETLQDGETWGGTYMGTNTLKSAGTLSNSGTIQVAVIDTGCWADNPFFEGRSFSDKSRSFPDNDGPFVDVGSGYHGTHVAGILHTLTPANVELMILRVVDSNGDISKLMADTAIKYALENGAEVINISLGEQIQHATSPSTSFYMDQSLSAARNMGVPVVCSAGNYSQNVNTNYPACSEDTIAVSAIDNSGQVASSYSYGAGIDFCAPGVNVVSASKTGTASKSGTSMAAPHIAAAFAWLRLEDPTADWDGLYNRLKGLCTDLGESGKDELYGWGCPNLSALGTASADHAHHWTGREIEPTCTSRGYTDYTCDGCGLTRRRSYKGPVHSFNDSGVCARCGKTRTTACGEGMTWSYSSATETLTISGSGTVTTASWEELYPRQFIRRVYLPDASGVADGLFAGYLSLESVQVGDNLTTLGKKCFSGCTALKKIILPDGLTAIGDGALCGCTALATIDNRSSDFTVVDDCLLYNKNKTRLIACGGAWNGGTLTVADTVTQIGERALEGVSGLTELRLSPSLKKIGTGAFQSCANLERVYARSSVTTVGSNPFGSDTATVYVSEGCTGWEDHNALGKKLQWASYPGDLSRWTMSLTDTNWAYTGSTRRPGIILSSGSITARNYGSDSNFSEYFTYRYTNNTSRSMKKTAPKSIR